jgi:hypothetical protein
MIQDYSPILWLRLLVKYLVRMACHTNQSLINLKMFPNFCKEMQVNKESFMGSLSMKMQAFDIKFHVEFISACAKETGHDRS